MRSAIALAACVAVLGLVNYSIFEKERQLSRGKIVYLELAPVDVLTAEDAVDIGDRDLELARARLPNLLEGLLFRRRFGHGAVGRQASDSA